MYKRRFFKYYSPAWLQQTAVGELLAEADWDMKCLSLGAKTNEDKTVFKSRSQSTQLKNLAAAVDFPSEEVASSIIMSCDLAKVQKDDNEIKFLEEPKIVITDGCSSLYSKYISQNYQSVAYYDEPRFLKMQELIKLILAVEWLYNEKGVRVNEEWMMKHTSKALTADAPSTRKEPPNKMVPKPAAFKPPSSDVTVKSWELELYRTFSKKCIGEQRFGYYDDATMIAFKEDGTQCPPQKYLNCCIEYHSTALPESKVKVYFPMSLQPTEFRDKVLKLLPKKLHREITFPMAFDDLTEESEMELTQSLQLSPLPLEETLTITVSTGELFTSEDPNMLIQPEIPGVREAIFPDVKSWDELISERTVPIPCMWQQGTRKPAAMGGVSTCDFRVEERSSRKMPAHKETPWKDNYKKRGHILVVRAQHVTAQGSIRLVGRLDSANLSQQFSSTWKKNNGSAPILRGIFAITNPTLERRWENYKAMLRNKTFERHYHGTTLACDIMSSGARLCSKGDCGVCGISSAGLDPQSIGKNIDFQRFGSGFYLAPNSSKCHDYTEGAHNCRAMLLCDVLPGNKFNLDTNKQTLTGPPPGYDSVYGQVGNKLNYPEIVVYKPEAVMPRYIIIYQKDGIEHPLKN